MANYKNFISFSSIRPHSLYILLASIFIIFDQYSERAFDSRKCKYYLTFCIKYIPKLYLLSISKILSGTFVIISYYLQKKRGQSLSSSQISVISTPKGLSDHPEIKQNFREYKTYLFILIISISELILKIFLDIFHTKANLNDSDIDNLYLFPEFICCSILGIFLFNERLHRHHYFSFVIILIGIIISYIDLYINIKENPNLKMAKRYLKILIKGIIYSIFYSFSKVIMDKYLVSPFLFIFLQGFYDLIFVIIFSIIATKLNCVPSSLFYMTMCYNEKKVFSFSTIKYIFENQKLKCGEPQLKKDPEITVRYYLKSLSFLIDHAGYELLIMIVVKYFQPSHDSFLLIIKCFFIKIINSIFHYDTGAKVNFYFGSLFFLFGELIYNEVIVLNVFGLSKYTKQSIEKRGENDVDILQKDILLSLNEIDSQPNLIPTNSDFSVSQNSDYYNAL